MSATTAASYAKAVVTVLCDHFPDLTDPETAGIITNAIQRQVQAPRDGFEVIVDNPGLANWRLKGGWGGDRRRVRIACYRLHRRDSDVQLERTVNDALSVFEAREPGEEQQR